MRHVKPIRYTLLLLVASLLVACGGGEQQTGQKKSGVDEGAAAEAVKAGSYKPPKGAEPCGNDCPYEGDTVTVTVNTAGEEGPISGPLYEVREEFEAATGAKLEIVELPFAEHFPKLMNDLTSQTGQYDASIAGAWWLGDLVGGDFIVPYDKYYDDPSFPQWDDGEVLTGPRDLLSYGGEKYMVANDHDGQVMYYRRDLLEDPKHQKAFQEKYGYELRPPQTWDEFGDVAEYFNGKDLNGDGQGDSGLTMHLKVGGQGMFHFMSFSAPYVIGPENPSLYWFDPENMEPLVESEGHRRAMELYLELVQYGPQAMAGWALGEAWQYFLDGNAMFTYSWGDVAALAVERDSYVKGIIGTAQLPGTLAYVNPQTGEEYAVTEPNLVGNTTGGSWSGVIMKASQNPDLAYYFLALNATEAKQRYYAARGTDGVDPGKTYQILPPTGTGAVEDYVALGWDPADAEDYTKAYYDNYQNPNQLPFLRIPGTFEYWTAMDIQLSEAVTQAGTPEQVLQTMADEFQRITDNLGRDQQLEIYKRSVGL